MLNFRRSMFTEVRRESNCGMTVRSLSVIYMVTGPLSFSIFSVLALECGGSVWKLSLWYLALSLICNCFSVIGGSLKR